MADPVLPPLEDPDLEMMAALLARFAVNHLDQWEVWSIDTGAGLVEVRMLVAQEEAPGAIRIWPRPR